MLSSRIDNPFCKYNDFSEGTIEKDCINKVDLALQKELGFHTHKNYHHTHLG